MAQHLTAGGHVAYRPTLTGLGERRHLARPEVNLDTHITDVTAVIETEDLHDVILVGQSYGGAVVTGVADRVSQRLEAVVYVDAFVPRHGQSVNDLSPARFVEATWVFTHFAEQARADGWDMRSLPVGHDAQIIAPDRLAEILVDIAAS